MATFKQDTKSLKKEKINALYTISVVTTHCARSGVSHHGGSPCNDVVIFTGVALSFLEPIITCTHDLEINTPDI